MAAITFNDCEDFLAELLARTLQTNALLAGPCLSGQRIKFNFDGGCLWRFAWMLTVAV